MFFSRKGRLKRSGDQQLLQSLDELKSDWMHQKEMVERSVEPSEEVLYKLHLAESKYFFLLREAKKRNVTTTRLK